MPDFVYELGDKAFAIRPDGYSLRVNIQAVEITEIKIQKAGRSRPNAGETMVHYNGLSADNFAPTFALAKDKAKRIMDKHYQETKADLENLTEEDIQR